MKHKRQPRLPADRGLPKPASWHARTPALRARTFLGLRQEQVAAELGVTQAAISQWEKGQTEPRPEHYKGLIELVARELMSLLKREAMVVRAEDEVESELERVGIQAGNVSDLLRELERFAPQANALAAVLVGGARIGLSKKGWCTVLGLSPRILNGVPKVEGGLLCGFDVGLALEAAVRGRTYRHVTGGNRPDPGGGSAQRLLAHYGQQRLAQEVGNAFRGVLDAVHLGYHLTQVEMDALRRDQRRVPARPRGASPRATEISRRQQSPNASSIGQRGLGANHPTREAPPRPRATARDKSHT